jgi:addiction module RelB/DinJ family antitoxin
MTTLSLKIEDDLKKGAEKMAEAIGISLSGLIKMLLKNTIRSGRLDLDTNPRYHDRPMKGDRNFATMQESIEYLEKLANEKRKMAKEF